MMRFRIDIKIFIFLILFYFTKQIKIYSITLAFCMIHELGHLLAGILLKMKPEKIELMPLGLTISFKISVDDYNKKIKKANLLELKKLIVAMAGPVVNIILIIVLKELVYKYVNILILLFNLIPIYPLDGGRILKSLIYFFFGNKKSKIYINTISNITIVILTMMSSIAIYYFKNIAILFIIIFLWCIVIKENKKYKLNMRIFEKCL